LVPVSYYHDMIEQIQETLAYIRKHSNSQPEIGIILGTGLGGLAEEISVSETMSYADLPHFPISTVETHKGRLIFGDLGGKKVVVMQGRFHYYEGYSMQEVTFPVRVLKFLGITSLFISNVAGGLNPEFELSDLMVIRDHINLLPENPLRGYNDDELGPRFPDMSTAYDRDLIELANQVAADLNIHLKQGVYVVVSGPNLETEAEYLYVRTIGGDAIGMSTVPENIVARHMNIPCFAISVITDLGVPGKIERVTVEKVVAAAHAAEPTLTRLIGEMIKRL